MAEEAKKDAAATPKTEEAPRAPVIRARRAGADAIISISGRFDFSAHQKFREAYESMTGAQSFAVDLGDTDYVDSSGLGMLLILREVAGSRTVKIEKCKPAVRRILEIANFQKLFTLT